MKIDILDLCDALRIEYDPAKSIAFYLHLVKQYRFQYEANKQSRQDETPDEFEEVMSQLDPHIADYIRETRAQNRKP